MRLSLGQGELPFKAEPFNAMLRAARYSVVVVELVVRISGTIEQLVPDFLVIAG